MYLSSIEQICTSGVADKEKRQEGARRERGEIEKERERERERKRERGER